MSRKMCYTVLVLMMLISGYLNAQFFLRVSVAATTDNTYSNGCSWGDYNNDGFPDLFVATTTGNNLLYQNDGAGGLTRITTGAIVSDGGNSLSAVWSDYNNDGYLDLYVSNRGSGYPISAPPQSNFLYLNDGPPDYTFTKVTDQLPATDANYTWSSSWVDYDNDGWLDLHVPENLHSAADFFYKNDGAGGFTAITLPFILPEADDPSTGVASWIDYNNDGDQDVLLAKSGRFLPLGAEDNRLFESQLTELGIADSLIEITSGDLVTHFDRDFQASWGDYDNDGDMDVLLGNFDGANYLYRNDGGDTFAEIAGQPVVTDNASTLGSCWGDYDNDGDLDLFVSNTNGFPARVFRNEGSGNFTQMTFADLGNIVTTIRTSNSCALADYDNDGDLDFYVANSSTPVGTPQNNDLYRNDQGNSNNWIAVSCVGTVSNSSAVGAKIRLKAQVFGNSYWQLRTVTGSPTGDRGQNHQRVHFGLGDATVIDSLTIEWPSGIKDVYADLPVNQFVTAVEDMDISDIGVPARLPEGFVLKQNYPNPFNPSTTIEFELPAASEVTLQIFNNLGQPVATPYKASLPVGTHKYVWNSTDAAGNPAASGIYYYRLQAGDHLETRKMLLIR